jgi:hypothetical protein
MQNTDTFGINGCPVQQLITGFKIRYFRYHLKCKGNARADNLNGGMSKLVFRCFNCRV